MNWKSLINQHVQFKDAVLELEIGFEPGMRAVVKAVRDEHDDCDCVEFDFAPYEEYNKPFMSPEYFDNKGNARLKWCETKFYPENKIEEVYVDTKVLPTVLVNIVQSTATLDDEINALLPIVEQMKLGKVASLLKKALRKPYGPCPILFLDIDGVLNGHRAFNNGYNGMERDLVENLNYILECEPDVKIVVSSAWRYIVLGYDMTVTGFEYVLRTHGAETEGRIHGITGSDEVIQDKTGLSLDSGNVIRKMQIEAYVATHKIPFFVVVDDLPLPMTELVQTDGGVGLTKEIAKQIREKFQTYRRKMLTGEGVSDTLLNS